MTNTGCNDGLNARSMRFALLAITILLSSACSPEQAPRPDAVQARHAYDTGTQFVDVRTDAEWNAGHLKNALHLPLDQVAARASALLPDKDATLMTYCASGVRAQRAAQTLRKLGYKRVTAMTGGFKDLQAAGYPTVDHS